MVYLGVPIKNGDLPWLCQITKWYIEDIEVLFQL